MLPANVLDCAKNRKVGWIEAFAMLAHEAFDAFTVRVAGVFHSQAIWDVADPQPVGDPVNQSLAEQLRRQTSIPALPHPAQPRPALVVGSLVDSSLERANPPLEPSQGIRALNAGRKINEVDARPLVAAGTEVACEDSSQLPARSAKSL